MIFDDINYLNKIVSLRSMGFNVIDRVDYEILDDSDISDSNNCKLDDRNIDYLKQ